MGSTLPMARVRASNPAANFGREILKIEAVENVGKKLPGYSFGKLARALWPQKTPASIEFYTGAPERTARHIAADKSDPGSALLVQILDSDQGWRALAWVMRDSRQPWWLEVARSLECSRAYEARREQLKFDL